MIDRLPLFFKLTAVGSTGTGIYIGSLHMNMWNHYYWTTIDNVISSHHIDNNISPTTTQSNGVDDRLLVATSVAKDLFQYMQSFDDGQRNSKDYMTVPVTIFTQWMERFERRFRLDPHFF
jgi:hypothetical protein